MGTGEILRRLGRAAVVMGLAAGLASAAEVRVDCARPAGTIRPLHGVNDGPVTFNELTDLSAYYRELGVPYARLHDCHWPNPDVVDIHAVFPDFRADPGLPASYRFTRTDDYIQSIVATGSKIVYRLGESIEHTRRKYHVAPPADAQKWAAVCIGIIRHYNEGWADGFRHGIRYWEIWNEPENRPAMWTGTDADYYRLYATAAKAIKARFPDVLVGGPSVGYGGKVTGTTLEPTPFLAGFLRLCREESVPLDFFSWHRYTANPYAFHEQACAVRRLLDENGFAKTESHLNEWNYLPGDDWQPMLLGGQGLVREKFFDEMGGAPGAAFVACALLFLQDSPVDVANFYRGDTGGFGLFNEHGTPKKVFYAMKAFRALLDTPRRVEARGSVAGRLAVVAGVNAAGTEVTVLVSRYRSDDEPLDLAVEHLPWDGPTLCEVFLLDASRNLERVSSETRPAKAFRLSHPLPAPSVLLLKLSRPAPGEAK